MKRFYWLGRLTVSASLALGLGFFITQHQHRSYWYGTIRKVQTVDFNILSHMLPTKLSYALKANDLEEVQRTVSSNYTLFGLVVTNPTGDKVIAASGDGSRSRSWDAVLQNTQLLQNHPYDLLLDPPPLYPQATYDGPGATNRTVSNLINEGRVIGRVYYVRGEPPVLFKDLSQWISRGFYGSERYVLYNFSFGISLALGLAGWGIWEWSEARRLLRKREADQLKQEAQQLSLQNEALNLQLQERIDQLQEIRDRWQSEQLTLIRQLEQNQRTNQLLEKQIAQFKETIQALQQQQVVDLSAITHFKEQVESLQQQLEQLDQAQQTNQLLEEQIAQFKETIQVLQQQQADVSAITQLEEKAGFLEQQLEQSRQQEADTRKRAEEATGEMQRLNEEIEILRSEIKDGSDEILHPFEKEILNLLTNSLTPADQVLANFEVGRRGDEPRVIPSFDVGRRGDGSRVTDFLVGLKNCVVVLEAKSYVGQIHSDDPRNRTWLCNKKGRDLVVTAAGGINPYRQVMNYCNCLMSHIRRFTGRNSRLPVYGVVVFPKGSDIDPELSAEFDEYYKVTTVEQLLPLLGQLDQAASRKRNSRLTGHDFLGRLKPPSTQT